MDSKNIKNQKERERVEKKNRSLDELRAILMSRGKDNGRRWTELDTLEKIAELIKELEEQAKLKKKLPKLPLQS